jgi:hypothetical protein
VSVTIQAAVQLSVDTDNRARVDYPSDGYVATNPDEFQVQDTIKVGFGTVRELWAEGAADTDDWLLLYVEAGNMPITLAMTTLDAGDSPGATTTLELAPGLPLLLGTRFVPGGTLRFNTVTVTGPASTAATVRFSIAR